MKPTEPSVKARTTSSSKYWKMNPGDIDDATIEALGGFKHAKAPVEDPAYKKVLRKLGKVENLSRFGGALLGPKPRQTHEALKDWSRGKGTES